MTHSSQFYACLHPCMRGWCRHDRGSRYPRSAVSSSSGSHWGFSVPRQLCPVEQQCVAQIRNTFYKCFVNSNAIQTIQFAWTENRFWAHHHRCVFTLKQTVKDWKEAEMSSSWYRCTGSRGEGCRVLLLDKRLREKHSSLLALTRAKMMKSVWWGCSMDDLQISCAAKTVIMAFIISEVW